MKLFVYDKSGAFVAQIGKQPKLADGFNPNEPWLLLHKTGRIERFGLQSEAKAEARKSWGSCRFSRA
jgi:hypothetical protein